MVDFKMPSLGAEMEWGRLLEWKVKVGDPIHRGDIVAVVDTDKAAIQVEVWHDGVVQELIAKPGEKVPVGQVIARFDSPIVVPVETKPPASAPIKATARIMERSKREIPHYYLEKEIDAGNLLRWLSEFNGALPVESRILPIVPILKAVAKSCKEELEFNGTYEAGIFTPQKQVNLGVILSLKGQGLMAPVIQDADQLSMRDLMKALDELVKRAKSGGLRSSDIGSGTISVTNLLESGVTTVFGVIYPPQVALLGVGSIHETCGMKDGRVEMRRVFHLGLSADHRVSDGHSGARFLGRIESLLQEPDSL